MIKVPDYRFKNYTEPWEDKKLGKVAEVNPKSVVPDEFKYVDLGAVVGTEMVSYRNETISTSPSRAQRLAVKGDVFYQTVRPYQKNNYLFRKDDNDYVFSTGYAQLRPNGDGCFLLSYLQTNKFVNVVLDNCTGTSYPAINSKDLSDISISLPSLPEQTAIGSFFQEIDQLISLQQRKLEVLKEQKKTYLNLLFPTKVQKKPALRFAGFEDEWKRQNLGHYLVEYNEKTKVENQHELLSSTNNGIEPRTGRVSGESNVGYKVLKKGMIVLSPQNLWLGNINYNSEYELGIVSPSYKIYDIERVDKRFLAVLIHHPYMLFEYGQASVQGASVVRRNLDLDLFKEIQIPLPSIKEQKIIGLFFQKLDRAIAKQEEKVNYLKESKQTLLRKMFI